MQPCRILSLHALVVGALLGGALDAKAESFTYQALNTDGNSVPVPYGMNTSGTVVGGGSGGGFVWSAGVLQFVAGVGAFYAVNDSGIAVGAPSDNKRGEYASYDITTGTLSDVPLKIGGGKPEVIPFGIGSTGEVVGVTDGRDADQGFVVVNGIAKKLLPRHEKQSELVSINSSGVVLGNCTACLQGHNYYNPFIYANGKFTTLSLPESAVALGNFITDSGVVGGTFNPNGSPTEGFVYKNGKYTTYSPAGSTYVSVTGIGPNGQVVGTFADSAGNYHGFVYVKDKFHQIDVPHSTSTDIAGISVTGAIFGIYRNSSGGFGYIGTCAADKVCTK
jgi:probable HAF family extracellular repeat protein